MIEHRAADPAWAAELSAVETAFGAVLTDRGRSLEETRDALDDLMTEGSTVVGEPLVVGGVPLLRVRAGRSDAVLVWLHGGGYMLGSAAGYLPAVATLAYEAGVDLLVPDYRLAPEHRFPAASEDCLAAATWAIEEYGAPRVLLGGDSAGGALALTTALTLRDSGAAPLAGLVLVSPLADLTASGGSMVTNAETDAVISSSAVGLIATVYLGRNDREDPRASPVFADLSGLPPALLLASAREALLDDAMRLHDGLVRGEVPVRLLVYADTCHAWTLFPGRLGAARAALTEAADFFREQLVTSTPPRPANQRHPRTSLRRHADVTMAWLRDLLWARPARTADQIPARPSDVTPQWLTEALAPNGGTTVKSVTHEPISSGTSVRSLLRVSYEHCTGHPGTIFVKSTPTLRTRLQVGSTGGAEAELRFYRDIQPTLPVAAPRGWYGRADRVSGRSIILLEDLANTRSACFGDPTSVRIDEPLAGSLVDVLATLHGTLEESPRFGSDLRWVRRSLDVQLHLDDQVDFARRTRVGLDRAADLVGPELLAVRDRLHDLLLASLSLDDDARTGLNHTDVHAGNWFHTPEGEMGLFDWSAIARGQGARDLAYALGSSLTVEDRRAWERDLVARYSDRLGEVTGRPQEAEAIWAAYRQQTLHGLCYWLYTLGRGRMQPQMQPEAITRTNISRLAAAATDLGSVSLLASIT